MVRHTLCFSNPARLSLARGQIVIERDGEATVTVPAEDVGLVVIDTTRLSITSALLTRLAEENVAVVVCDSRHHPAGLQLPLEGNTLTGERIQRQTAVSAPLRKRLWQQSVKAKIHNQSVMLARVSGERHRCMDVWAGDVKSGDPDNLEGRAAAYYWPRLMQAVTGQRRFVRDRDGEAPNNLLNYGYAIVRAIVARAIVCAGFHPALGIHHHNRYNAFCLADDLMEPYRPYVDMRVAEIMADAVDEEPTLGGDARRRLLEIATIDVHVGRSRRPLVTAVGATVASLVKCYAGTARSLVYPLMPDALCSSTSESGR